MWRLSPLVILLAACTQDPVSAPVNVDSELPEHRPNILLIVADDLGYSDIGAYGGEIATPNLDELAANGLTLTNFYTGPTCSVSRSMLVSGADNHIAGLGNMAETVADNQLGLPGYEGHLNDSVETIAEVLSAAGYRTYLSGKWHLGMQPEQSPSQRGFDLAFSPLFGGGSHFSDMRGPDAHRDPLIYRDNGRLVNEVPEDFFSTTYYTDRVISQIDSDIDSGSPFFAFLSYTAPHWPLHAPQDYIDKYEGRYDIGYDRVREARLAKQKTLGIIPSDTAAVPRPGSVKPWADLNADEQSFHARNMEIYAAMVDHMDMSIGRVLDFLRDKGQLDNTMVVFISDNGAESWNYETAPPPVGKFALTFDNSPENRGRVGSFIFYGPEWGHVSNVPFTRSKGSAYQGGVRSPAIVYWPAMETSGRTSSALSYITDWYSTFAEVAGSDKRGVSGKSLVPVLQGTAAQVRDDADTMGIEVWGKKAVIGQRYKLVSSPKKPHGEADWALYDLVADPAEQNDLAAQEPEIVQTMLGAWDDYVSENNVVLPTGEFKVRPAGEIPLE
ncbi:MAG: arylsulfatase [Pseudomonadota bacterium]